MTDSKRDHKPRSAFLPLLFLCVAILLGGAILLMLAPLYSCDGCMGIGRYTAEERQNAFGSELWYRYDLPPGGWECDWCEGSGTVSGLHKYRGEGPALPVNDDLLRAILEHRQARPRP